MDLYHSLTSVNTKLSKFIRIIKPSISVVAQWILDACKFIPTDLLKQFLINCGISNANDGNDNKANKEATLESSDEDSKIEFPDIVDEFI